MKRISITLLACFFLLSDSAYAGDDKTNLPQWEAGLAIGAASLPQYMGSDERYVFAAPLPYFVYRGDRVKMDRGGLRAAIFDMEQLSLDVSLGAGLPVRNSNRARAGMPTLNFNLQAGPRLNWHVFDDSGSTLKLRLPVRGILDTSGAFLGWLSEPDIQLRFRPYSDLKIELTSGLLFASKKYHATYYDVAPIYATATRPAYQSKAGLHSVSASAKLVYQYSDTITLFSVARYRNLSPGSIRNSPLVKDRNYLSFAAGIAWSLYQSESLSRISEDD
ncbi:MipA/OmpV family protein [Mariprofundus micogutta]|nr:MipA/OmpV family protein [Mariprofundus micogutta]